MKHLITPAIMSGGSGTRLWPLSTQQTPKQFHALAGDRTMIQQTILRAQGETEEISFSAPIILASAAHRALVAQQLAAIGCAPQAVALEPMGRNTAATAAIAAALATETDPDALVLLLPADHVITDVAGFHAVIARAAPMARGHIVTFGIEPSRPETGYGYIRRGESLADGVFAIDSFREKPNAATAQSYLDQGGFSWNAGMFLFHPRVLLEEMGAAAAIRDGALAALAGATREGVDILLDAALFAAVPSQPLDIAVMEKTTKGAVAPCDIGWADIGSWDEVWRLAARDANGNAHQGPTAMLDGANNLLLSAGPTICAAGIEDLIIVATKDAVVVLPRARAQEVKAMLEAAKQLQPRD